MEQYINRITCADCLDILKQLPDKCVDLVCTDCPYKIISGGCTTGLYGNDKKDIPVGCGKCAKKWETAGQLNKNYKNIKSGKMFEQNNIEFSDWLPEIYRVLKDNTHCYIMINGRNLADLQKESEKAGFVFQQLLVWDKGNSTPNKWYLNACEFILMLRKGNAVYINDMGQTNILRVPNLIGNKIHPTEKPIGLNEILIRNSTKIGDLVLDPFSGSGSVACAAKRLQRNFICVEKDPEYYALSIERLQDSQKQQNLF